MAKPNKEYAFDVKFFATIRVPAASEKEAREFIANNIHCAQANFGALPNGDPIVTEVTIDDDEIPLIEIDGEYAA